MDERNFAKSVAMEAAVVRKSLNNLMGSVNGLVWPPGPAQAALVATRSRCAPERHAAT